MTYLRSTIQVAAMLGIIAGSLYVGMCIKQLQWESIEPPSAALITQMDLQRQLVDLGFDIKVDGIIGEETRRAWDLALFNQYANKWIDKQRIKSCPK